MIEAMDNSLLPSSNLSSLKHMDRATDCFQATYGWETEWQKSSPYVYNTPPPDDQQALMPAVSPINPQSDLTMWHHVPVITNCTTFLRIPINQPIVQFSILCDIILNFSFPPSHRPLPLTLLCKVIGQNLVSKLRPHLALQPISHHNAVQLDHLLALKIHQYLAFPFHFKTLLLTTPLSLRGLAFFPLPASTLCWLFQAFTGI